jgi:hypothetical protein
MRQGILYIAVFALVITALSVSPVMAQTTPVQVALVNPVQIFPEGTSVSGIRWNILYGKNIAMTGLDFGLVNHVGTGGFTGIQLGLVGLNEGNFTGVQWNGVNITKMNIEGAQLGWFSSASYVHGVQISLVNYAGSMKGIQIGIINIIDKGGMFPVFPIANWSL